jgi:hypothetical protein
MHRTGALHVSYLPGDKPDKTAAAYEKRGRDMFAKSNDPYLTRAVEYTTLFQAFRQLGITSADETASAEALVATDAIDRAHPPSPRPASS